MLDTRPFTPPEVELQLRREACFGCCKCGCPIIIYHHIIPWKIEHHFRPQDMMCFCPNDATEADSGAMPEAKQRFYKLNPRNKIKGFAKGKLVINHNIPIIGVGNVELICGINRNRTHLNEWLY